MQFEALHVFCDVVRYRSFSKAARANDLSQPAVSQIVSQLENRLQVQLIDRSTRPLQLTEPGQSYYEGCRDLVARYMELEAAIRQTHAALALTLQVAAIYSVGLGNMGCLIEQFTQLHPNARVHIEYLHPDRVYERVLDGTADLGLVSYPRKMRELTILPWREETMVLACGPRHPLADKSGVKPADLHGWKYIGFEQGLMIRREVDRFLREAGVEVENEHVFDNIENIKKAVEESGGVALLPEPTMRREVQAGTLIALPLLDCALVRPVGIIHRRHYKLSVTAQRFIDLLRQSERDRSPHINGRDGQRNGRHPSTRRKNRT